MSQVLWIVKSDSNSDDLSDDEESWWEKRHEEFEEIIAEQIKETQEKARAQKELAWANYLNSQLVSQQRLQGFLRVYLHHSILPAKHQ